MTSSSAPAAHPADLSDRAGLRVGLALASLSLGSFVIGAGEFGIMGLLPTMAEDLRVTISKAGLLVTGYALGVVFGAPLLAVLTSRWERKRTLVLLALVFVVGNLACALSPTYGVLMAARLFTALAHGAFFGIGAVLAAEIAKPGKEAQAISMLFVGMTLANVFGVPLGTVIGQAFGWRSAFFVVSALAAATAAMIALFVPVSRPRGRACASRRNCAPSCARPCSSPWRSACWPPRRSSSSTPISRRSSSASRASPRPAFPTSSSCWAPA